ncbi:cupin domain-containing protein [bacterium]|nr:cupin domain-containing protein [bacterium]
MKKKYKFLASEAKKLRKHGIDLVVYGEGVQEVNVVAISVEEGHFQEFFDEESYFIYYIVEGKGLFVLDDERVEVKPTDLIVVPPKTRIHYFGTMKMILTVSPAFKEENERHVRFIKKSESPYSSRVE